MQEEIQNIMNIGVIINISLCYTYLISSKLPQGMPRFYSLLPIITLFILLPLYPSRPLTAILTGGFISWIATFKLLLYTFNLGPLSSPHANQSILTFILFSAFPIRIKHKCLHPNNEPNKVFPLRLGTKVFLFIILELVYYYKFNSRVVFCCLLYLAIEITCGLSNLFMGSIFGLELDPPSDEPYLSTSLQDFWGRRWNRMVSDTLRHTIYKPVRSTLGSFIGQRWAPLPAMMTSFLVSGLMHELVYYYATRVKPTWEVTCFFVLHGGCVIVEMVVKRALGNTWRLHWAVTGPLTVGFVMKTSFWLFFPQLMRNGIDVKANEDIIGYCMYVIKFMRLN